MCALLCATLDGIVIARSEPTEERPQHLCLDAGYDGAPAYQEIETRHYVPHIRSRGEEKEDKTLVPWLSRSAMGSGAFSLVDQSLASSPGTLGEKRGELSRFSPPGLRPIDLCQSSGFRISTKCQNFYFMRSCVTQQMKRCGR